MKKTLLFLTVGTLLAGCAGHHEANSGGMGSAETISGTEQVSASSAPLSDYDAHFLQDAAQRDLEVIRLGQLIVQNGQNQYLKGLGQDLIDDHTKANNDLAQIAAPKGISLPTTVSQDQMLGHLGQLNAPEFDYSAQRDAIRSHEAIAREFGQARNQLQDPALKAWVQKYLPMFDQHLATARDLNLGIPTTRDTPLLNVPESFYSVPKFGGALRSF